MATITAQKPKKKLGKRLIVWLIIVVVLAGAGVGGWLWWQGQQQRTEKATHRAVTTAATTTGMVDTSKVSQAEKQAATEANTTAGGSVEQGVKVYEQAIKSTPSSDTATTAVLYYDEAKLLYNDGQYQAALTAAQKAVEFDPSAANYGILGTIYQQLGQKDNAITAYKHALTAINAVTSDGGAGKAAMTTNYTQQIKALGGSV